MMIEPSTGEILAMVSAPTYDPALLTGKMFGSNSRSRKKSYRPLINRSIAGTYPPGSTFKPTQAHFLQEGIITPKHIACYGIPPLGGRPDATDTLRLRLFNTLLPPLATLSFAMASIICWATVPIRECDGCL